MSVEQLEQMRYFVLVELAPLLGCAEMVGQEPVVEEMSLAEQNKMVEESMSEAIAVTID